MAAFPGKASRITGVPDHWTRGIDHRHCLFCGTKLGLDKKVIWLSHFDSRVPAFLAFSWQSSLSEQPLCAACYSLVESGEAHWTPVSWFTPLPSDYGYSEEVNHGGHMTSRGLWETGYE